MSQFPLRNFTSFLVLGVLAAGMAVALAESVPLPKARPAEAAANTAGSSSSIPAPEGNSQAPRFTATPALPISSADLAALKEAITAARRSNIPHASELQGSISDPLARKLIEWSILRNDDS
jgi:soluble lytic murein transglycosylase